MGPLDKYVLRDDALIATETGCQLKFQSHWYRSLPLSCMDFRLKINGKEVDNQQVRVEVNGEIHAYTAMPDLDANANFLFILDRATLHIPRKTPLKRGQKYSIEFTLNLYPPYILVGPEAKPLMAGTTVKKSLVCQ